MGIGTYGLLLIGGEGPDRKIVSAYLDNVGFTIAADSGFDLALKLKIRPDLLVGDLDSVAKSPELESFPAEKIRLFPENKDETDTEIGLRLFHELGYEQVILAGGGGGRLDHLLGIVSLLEREHCPKIWLTARDHIQVIEGELELENWKGQTVSFFPLGESVGSMDSEGLKWPLTGMEWKRGEMGISNIVTSDHGRVRVGKGKLLMIRTLAESGNA